MKRPFNSAQHRAGPVLGNGGDINRRIGFGRTTLRRRALVTGGMLRRYPRASRRPWRRAHSHALRSARVVTQHLVVRWLPGQVEVRPGEAAIQTPPRSGCGQTARDATHCAPGTQQQPLAPVRLRSLPCDLPAPSGSVPPRLAPLVIADRFDPATAPIAAPDIAAADAACTGIATRPHPHCRTDTDSRQSPAAHSPDR